MSVWHKRSEKDPVVGELVLIYYLEGFISIGVLDTSRQWRDIEGDRTIRPSYWMTLPKPPSEGEETG